MTENCGMIVCTKDERKKKTQQETDEEAIRMAKQDFHSTAEDAWMG